MIQKKQIVIEIDGAGNCSVDGQGFQGTECANFIGEIEKSLGQRISQTDKREYSQRQTHRSRNIQKERN